ncbi:MAG: hypothetical protein WB440_18945 [Steroidobacteraceae bacterium]|jgi:hypothetical protein
MVTDVLAAAGPASTAFRTHPDTLPAATVVDVAAVTEVEVQMAAAIRPLNNKHLDFLINMMSPSELFGFLRWLTNIPAKLFEFFLTTYLTDAIFKSGLTQPLFAVPPPFFPSLTGFGHQMEPAFDLSRQLAPHSTICARIPGGADPRVARRAAVPSAATLPS